MTTKPQLCADHVQPEPVALTVGQLRASLGQYSDDCEVYLFVLVPEGAKPGNGLFEAVVSTCKNGFGCVQLNADNVYTRTACPNCDKPLHHNGSDRMYCSYCGLAVPHEA